MIRLKADDISYEEYIKRHNDYPICGAKHSKAVSETKVNLNFTEGGTSDRTYKVLASRGFLLTQSWPRIEEDFKIGVDLDTFDSVNDFKQKIEYYLTHEDERKEIAAHGYRTVQKFNRTNFAKEIISNAFGNH